MTSIRVLSRPQATVYRSPARFRVLVSGRRFGKTILSIEELLREVQSGHGKRCWYVAPTYRQAQQICWQMLKDRLSVGNWIASKNESDLSIILKKTGNAISLRGADNFDSLRGVILSRRHGLRSFARLCLIPGERHFSVELRRGVTGPMTCFSGGKTRMKKTGPLFLIQPLRGAMFRRKKWKRPVVNWMN